MPDLKQGDLGLAIHKGQSEKALFPSPTPHFFSCFQIYFYNPPLRYPTLEDYAAWFTDQEPKAREGKQSSVTQQRHQSLNPGFMTTPSSLFCLSSSSPSPVLLQSLDAPRESGISIQGDKLHRRLSDLQSTFQCVINIQGHPLPTFWGSELLELWSAEPRAEGLWCTPHPISG